MVISVYPAKYDKPPYIPANTIPNNSKQPMFLTNKNPISQEKKKSYNRDYRSYKEAVNPTKNIENKIINHHQTHPQKPPSNMHPHKHNEPVLSFEEYVPVTNSCKPEPSAHRKMSSRALGEDTENYFRKRI